MAKPTSIKIGEIKDKSSLKFKLDKKRKKLKEPTLHGYIVKLLELGV